ncbi:MAG: hypothetical protein AAFN93_06175 [Bacteroidota bacterium]
MSTEENNDNEMVPNSKLDAIKEIIFGENIKEYDYEFKQLKVDIKAQREAIEEEVNQVRLDLKQAKSELDKEIAGLKKDIEKLNDIKSDRKTLAKLLRTVADKLDN